MGRKLPNWRYALRPASYACEHTSLYLPGCYGKMCSSAVPLVPVREAGVGCVGSRPTFRLAFAASEACDMVFLRVFPGGFATFAFSQCVDRGLVVVRAHINLLDVAIEGLVELALVGNIGHIT